MINFKKAYYLKIIAITVTVFLFFNTTVYGTDLSDIKQLRIPLSSCSKGRLSKAYESFRRTKEKLGTFSYVANGRDQEQEQGNRNTTSSQRQQSQPILKSFSKSLFGRTPFRYRAFLFFMPGLFTFMSILDLNANALSYTPAPVSSVEVVEVITYQEQQSQKVTQEKIDRLIKQLDEDTTRDTAIDKLVKIGEPAVNPLIESLRNMDSPVIGARIPTIIALGLIGHERAVKRLIELLESQRYPIREAADTALVKIGEPAVSALTKELNSDDWWVQKTIARILGDIGDSRSAPALIKVLGDKNSGVRENAAKALGKIADTQTLSALFNEITNESSSIREHAKEVIINVSGKSAVYLTNVLSSKDKSVIQYASELLIEIGNNSIPALKEGLDSENSTLRQNTLKVLEQISPEDAKLYKKQQTQKLIKKGSPYIIKGIIALVSLTVIGGILWGIIRFLRNRNKPPTQGPKPSPASPSISRSIFNTIRQKFHLFMIVTFLTLIPISTLKANTPLLLSPPGQEEVVTPQDKQDEEVSQREIKRLIRDLLSVDNYNTSAARKTLRKLRRIGKPAISLLIEELNNSRNSWTTCDIISALGAIGDPSAGPVLIKKLYNEIFSVSSSASKALSKIGNTKAVSILIERLNNPNVKYYTMTFLGSMGPFAKKAVPALIKELENKDVYDFVREEAAEALGKIDDPQAVPALIKALMNEESGIQATAANALGEIGNPQAVPALIKALRYEDYAIRSYTAEALGKIGDPRAVPALIRVLNSEKRYIKGIRNTTAEALGKIGGKQVVSYLINNFQELKEDLGETVIVLALGKTGREEAVSYLINLLKNMKADNYPEIKECIRLLFDIGKTGVQALTVLMKDENNKDISYIKEVLFNETDKDNHFTKPFLIAAFAKIDSEHIAFTQEFLLHIDDEETITFLIEAAKDDNAQVRHNALKALDKIDTDRKIQVFIGVVLNDKNKDVGEFALETLGKIDDPDAQRVYKQQRFKTIVWPKIKTVTIKGLVILSLLTVVGGILWGIIRYLRNRNKPPTQGPKPPPVSTSSSKSIFSNIRRRFTLFTMIVLFTLIPIVPIKANAPSYTPATLSSLQDKQVSQEEIDELIRSLGGYGARSAIKKLVKIGKPAVHGLIKMLDRTGEKYWKERTNACETLGKIGDPEAIPDLVNALDDNHWSVIGEAANALLEIYKETAIDLTQYLGENFEKRLESYLLFNQQKWDDLVKIGTPAVNVLSKGTYIGNWEFRLNAVATLDRIGPAAKEAVSRLRELLLNDKTWDVRRIVAAACGSIGDPQAIPELVKALEFEDGLAKNNAVESLFKINTPRSNFFGHLYKKNISLATKRLSQDEIIKYAIEALGSWAICEPAIQILNSIGAKAVPDVINVLKTLKEDEHWIVRTNACKALGKIGDSQAVKVLIKALDDKYYNVSRPAAYALSEIGSAEAVAPLIKKLNSEDDKLKNNARQALVKIGEPAISALIKAWEKGYPKVLKGDVPEILIKMNSQRPRFYGYLFKDDIDSATKGILEENVIQYAIEALGIVHIFEHAERILIKTGKPAVTDLVSIVGHADQGVRVRAVRALGDIGDSRAVSDLIKALRADQYYLVRVNAAEALGKIVDSRAAPGLISAMGNRNKDVRAASLNALVKIGKASVSKLCEALENKSNSIRINSAKALGDIRDPGAVADLIKALDDKEQLVREVAQGALVKIGKPAVGALIETVNGDYSNNVTYNAAKALTRINTGKSRFYGYLHEEDIESAIKGLSAENMMGYGIEALKSGDDNIRNNAANILADMGRPAVPDLINSMESENQPTRAKAAETLGKIADPEAVPVLIKALGDIDTDVMQSAIEALAKIGEPAVTDLIKTLKDKDESVKRGGTEALVKIGKPSADQLTKLFSTKDKSKIKQVSDILIRIDKSSIPALKEALTSKNSTLRHNALKVLEQISPKDANAYKKQQTQKLVKKGSPYIIKGIIALVSLTVIGGILWGIIRFLRNRNKPPTQGSKPPPASTSSSKSIFSHIKRRFTLFTMIILFTLIPILPAKARAISYTPASITPLGIEEVQEQQSEKVSQEEIDRLRKQLDRYITRDAAIDKLIKIGEPAVSILIKTFSEVDEHPGTYTKYGLRNSATKALIQIGRPAVPALIGALNNKNWLVKHHAIEALGKIGDPQAVLPLISIVTAERRSGWGIRFEAKPEDSIWIDAIGALGEIRDKRAVPVLIKELDKGGNLVAAIALGKIGSTRAVTALIKALEDTNTDVRKNVAEALGNIGDDRAVPALIKALNDGGIVSSGYEGALKGKVAEALGNIGDDRAVPALIKALDDDSKTAWPRGATVAREAVIALGKIRDPRAAPAIISKYYRGLISFSADALINIGTPEARFYGYVYYKDINSAIKGLPQDEIIQYAIEALRYDEYASQILVKIGKPAIPSLIKTLADDSYYVREHAIETLGGIGAPAVPALITALTENLIVSEGIAEALASIGESGINPLIQLLANEDKSIRAKGEQALITIGDEAILYLKEALQSDNSTLRHHAHKVLKEISPEDAREWEGAQTRKLIHKVGPYIIKIAAALAVLTIVGGILWGIIRFLRNRNKPPTQGPKPPPASTSSSKSIFSNIRRRLTLFTMIILFTLIPILPAKANTLLSLNPPGQEKVITPQDEQDEKVSQEEIGRLIKQLGQYATEGAAIDKLAKIGKPAVDLLIELLKDTDWSICIVAAGALGQIGDERAVDPLIELLKGDNSYLSIAIINSLGQIGDERAVDPLIELLKGNDYYPGAAAVTALVKIGEPAVNSLVESLRDSNYNIRERTATILDRLNWIPQTQKETIHYYIAKRNWDALVKIGEPAVNPLIELLRSPRHAIRKATATALGQIGNERAVNPLIELLRSPRHAIRKATATALGQIGDERAVDPLIELLKDTDWSIREATATALGQIGDERAVDPLIELLRSRRYAIRKVTATALGQIGSDAVSYLYDAFNNKSYLDIHEHLESTLIQIGKPTADYMVPLLSAKDKSSIEQIYKILIEVDEASIPALKKALDSNNPTLRHNALKVLEQISPEDANAYKKAQTQKLVKKGSPYILKGIIALVSLTVVGGILWGIIRFLRNRNKPPTQGPKPPPAPSTSKSIFSNIRRRFTLFTMIILFTFIPILPTKARLYTPAPLSPPGIEEVITSQDKQDKKATQEEIDRLMDMWHLDANIDKLIKIGKPAIDHLIKRLKDEGWWVREDAAAALGNIGDERAVEPLIERLKDERWWVQKAAAVALGNIGDERAVKPLIEAVKDNGQAFQEVAAIALGNIGDERAVKPLIELLKDEDRQVFGSSPKVREAAAQALGNIGDERAVKPLVRLLKDETFWVQEAAAQALDKLNWKPQTQEHKIHYFIAKQNWNALVNIGKPAVDPLIEELNDTDLDVRRSAIETLDIIGDERAVEPLIERLKDENSDVQRVAAIALGNIENTPLETKESIVNYLKSRLQNADSKIRQQTLKVLEQIDPKTANDYKKQQTQKLVKKGSPYIIKGIIALVSLTLIGGILWGIIRFLR
ncbi:MAG: HEAT repeat domain-containing protein, partial [Candidatus Gorgyraea atricola]|nr:HEAT repeat domain-containing protein [Candidatus Gorgyraea atricola]